MNIIVAGCGNVGEVVTRLLCSEGHDVIIIDTDKGKVETLSLRYDVFGVVGNCASSEVLKDAGIGSCDIFIALTGNDELNILACLISRKLGRAKTISRLRNPAYQKELNLIKEELGLALVVNPAYLAALEMARVLKFPNASSIETFDNIDDRKLAVKTEEQRKIAEKP